MSLVGGHTSIAGGYIRSLQRIHEIGGNCMQIFSSSPRIWKDAVINAQTIEEFKTTKEELGIDPIYFHASYLINLADNVRIGKLSLQFLIHELSLASKLGIRGSIIHVGSLKTKFEKDTKQIIVDNDATYRVLFENIQSVLDNTPENTYFIIENAGSRKIGVTFSEIGYIISQLQSNRVRVCLDTAHLFASGYDFSSDHAMEQLIQEFDKTIGLEKLEVIQLNDSKDGFGLFRDRHENIGEGKIGIKTIKRFINHPAIRTKPLILEVPGFEDEGPDKKNIQRVLSLLQ